MAFAGGADASREDANAPGARRASFEDCRGRAQRDCSPSGCCAVDYSLDVATTGALRAILPKASPIVSEALSVTGRGGALFELMCSNDLEGVVAKHFGDPYDPSVRWWKIKNPDYTQKEGRGDLFNGPRRWNLTAVRR